MNHGKRISYIYKYEKIEQLTTIIVLILIVAWFLFPYYSDGTMKISEYLLSQFIAIDDMLVADLSISEFYFYLLAVQYIAVGAVLFFLSIVTSIIKQCLGVNYDPAPIFLSIVAWPVGLYLFCKDIYLI